MEGVAKKEKVRPLPTEQANGEELARGRILSWSARSQHLSHCERLCPNVTTLTEWNERNIQRPFRRYMPIAVCDACNAQHTRSGVIWWLEVDDIHVLAHAQ